MATTREELPRVSVGTFQDWQRLESNYKAAAITRVEELIRDNGLAAADEDALLAHMNQFVDRTITMAQSNLRINGRNFESLGENKQNTEPFDEALDRRIWSLSDTRLQWDKRIVETRRKLPVEIEDSLLQLFGEQADTERLLFVVPDSPFEDNETDIQKDEPSHYLEVEEQFRGLSAWGEELEQTVSSQQERAERVRTVAAEVRGLKS